MKKYGMLEASSPGSRWIYFTLIVTVAVALMLIGSDRGTTQTALAADGVDAPTATFPANAGTLGAIPDNNPGTPRNVTFTVAGLPAGAPSNVQVSMTFNPMHTWGGDINAVLIAPNATTFTLFARTGQVGANAGDSSDLSGPYVFTDSAAGINWWAEALARGATEALTPGSYRTTQAGPQPVNTTSPVTNLTGAFSGVANANGTWTLRLTDNAAGDTGTVSAASLTITGPAVAAKRNVDFSGDGRSDFGVVRQAAAISPEAPLRHESVREKLRALADRPADYEAPDVPAAGINWFINNSGTNTHFITTFGTAETDFLVPSDYDGDNKADVAVWRPGAQAFFYVLRSSDGTFVGQDFGITGDDPAITGDYDGDNKSDLAVYRCPALGAGDGQCYFYYRSSLNGSVVAFPWGFGEQFDFFVNPGDFDGDGKFDYCIQATAPGAPQSAVYYLRRSSDGGVESVFWGRNTDIIIPGDYDGDGRYDFCVSRTETIAGVPGRSYYILERDGGGTGGSPIRWGIAGDVRTPGDYDGDGKTDIAVWRPSATPGASSFYVLKSSDGGAISYAYGAGGDFAIASWLVH